MNMTNFLEWVSTYDIWLVLLGLAALNAGKIWAVVERALCALWPSLAQTIQKRRETRAAQQQECTAVRRERDTVTALKEMLDSYRNELNRSTEERQILQRQLIEVIGKYERRDAEVIEVLRDISDLLREQSKRLEIIEDHIRPTRAIAASAA